MVTPVMLLLSSINDRYAYDRPVDVSYLSRADRNLITTEAERLGELANSENIMVAEDRFGNTMVDNMQVSNDKMVEVSWATAVIINRIREAYDVYKKAGISVNQSASVDNEDLGADAAILRLEGNPKYVYIYVYNIMEARGMDFSSKIRKITELYTAIIGHTGVTLDSGKAQARVDRFKLQSTVQLWQGLVISDMLKHGMPGIVVKPADIYKAASELDNLGFYGFVNPLKMYMEFSGSRITRKVGVNIAPEVTAFLDKVVRSGGVV